MIDLKELDRIRTKYRRYDDDDGEWVTTENGHKVHLNGEGVPDGGNLNVIGNMLGDDMKSVLDTVKGYGDVEMGSYTDKDGNEYIGKISIGSDSDAVDMMMNCLYDAGFEDIPKEDLQRYSEVGSTDWKNDKVYQLATKIADDMTNNFYTTVGGEAYEMNEYVFDAFNKYIEEQVS